MGKGVGYPTYPPPWLQVVLHDIEFSEDDILPSKIARYH